MSEEGQCKLLGPFSLLIQSCLGLLSLSSLIYKRYKEYPNRRPWRVWFFDVSKQVFGAIGIHFLNLLLSILGGGNAPSTSLSYGPFSQSSEELKAEGISKVATILFYIKDDLDDSNPCNWYFLNILFDTTIGVPILWGLLYVIFTLASKAGIQGISSGQYGVPPSLASYFKQLVLYFTGLLSMKLVVYILLMSVPLFEQIAEWLLSTFDPLPRLQVFMVTFVTPLVMNSLQYVLIDNIIQSPEYRHPKPIRIPDNEVLYENQEEVLRANLPEHGLLGQHEPVTLEGEFFTKP